MTARVVLTVLRPSRNLGRGIERLLSAILDERIDERFPKRYNDWERG